MFKPEAKITKNCISPITRCHKRAVALIKKENFYFVLGVWTNLCTEEGTLNSSISNHFFFIKLANATDRVLRVTRMGSFFPEQRYVSGLSLLHGNSTH